MSHISATLASEQAHARAGVYHYDEYDRQFLAERVAQFRDQVARRVAGELTEEEFRPLRLMNGLYLQLHAYMLRVAVPYGLLSSVQLRGLADIADKFDRGYGHFTTRQNVQFNWIKLEQAPDALEALAAVDMHAIQTSGNCIRNTTTDEFAGAAWDETVDPRVYAEILRQWSTLHPEFEYLPRKFKIAITGAPHDRAATKLHDIGLYVSRNAAGEVGFEVYAGGGLGRTPLVASKLRDFLPEREFLGYMEAILRVYNQLGDRANKYKARIKILVRDLKPAEFIALVEQEYERMNKAEYALDPAIVAGIATHFAPPPFAVVDNGADKLAAARAQDAGFNTWVENNTQAHKQPGYISAVISLKKPGASPGDASSAQMRLIADLADRYSFSELRVTHAQNIVLAHVRQDELYALYQALVPAELGTANIGRITDIIACPGLDYCALANARSIPLAQELARRFADPKRQAEIGEVYVNISGCINACGHHHVGNIGILGVDRKDGEAYQLTLGGSASNDASIGEIVGPARTAAETIDMIERIVDAYIALRLDGERFLHTYRRLGAAPFKEAAYAVA
jgi:sulfite reductase (NADPH) hemoprotein beta-component